MRRQLNWSFLIAVVVICGLIGGRLAWEGNSMWWLLVFALWSLVLWCAAMLCDKNLVHAGGRKWSAWFLSVLFIWPVPLFFGISRGGPSSVRSLIDALALPAGFSIGVLLHGWKADPFPAFRLFKADARRK